MRNSTTHPLYVSWIELEGDEGALGLTLCPGKYQPVASTGSWDRQLDVDVQALVDMGVSHVISLVTDDTCVFCALKTFLSSCKTTV